MCTSILADAFPTLPAAILTGPLAPALVHPVSAEGLFVLLPWFVLAGVLLLLGILLYQRGAGERLEGIDERLEGIDEALDALEGLDELRAEVARVAETRPKVDLRRLESQLGELRDGQRRLEAVLLQISEAAHATHASVVETQGVVQDVQATRLAEVEAAESIEIAPALSPVENDGPDLVERMLQRLTTMGYERVQLLPEEAQVLGTEDGEVGIEARRDGVAHKGRVLVREGRVQAVELQPAYSLFP